MNENNLFRINVGFLINQPVGVYREFDVNAAGISLDEDVMAKNVNARVRVSKVQQGILSEVRCSGQVELECVKCLEHYTQDLRAEFGELFAFHLRGTEDSDQFLPESGYMDLLPLIREYLLLEIPLCPICREQCKGLCPICGKNQNNGLCAHDETQNGNSECEFGSVILS